MPSGNWKLTRKGIRRALIMILVLIVLILIVLIIVSLMSLTPSRPENTAPFYDIPPDVKLPPTWKHQTDIEHIWLPNPENSQSSFPLDVNVTVFSENFNQIALAYIMVDITIPDSMVNSLNVRTLGFYIGVANASRVNATDLAPATGPFYMVAWKERNIYFPNRTASALIPYDWFASDYITFQDTGKIKLNLQYGSTSGENATPTVDWMQRNFMNVTVSVPIDILPYGTVYIEPTPTPKTFLGIIDIQDTSNLSYSTLWIIVPILCTIYWLLYGHYRTTNASRKRKDALSLPMGGMLWILGQALVFRPFDWNWFSVQGGIVALLAIMGPIFVFLISDELIIFFFRKPKGYKPHQAQANKKAEGCVSSEKAKEGIRNN